MLYMNRGNFENNKKMFNSNIECLQKLGKANVEMRISKADITGHWWLVKWLIVDGYFCFLFFNLTTASRLCQQYTSIEETGWFARE
ncbi:hypothetical protein T4E_221 [Trichinella pseudospiralis]|uniref:Uncharacterized protein n=1 Tax=Trichinella pseudospiralis TaxID=6337 RepID=A0A0V0YI71_TRIPS|nr:hypothetical protein T4E_221 [Trichinella pseudospiralis]